MPNKDITDISKEVLTHAQPDGTGEYLIYMLVLFMVLLLIAGLIAFWMWLKFQNGDKPVEKPPSSAGTSPTLADIETDLKQNLQISTNTEQIKELQKQITENTESTKRVVEAVNGLVAITEAQSNRLVQHDQVISQLSSVLVKQHTIITKMNGGADV